MKVTSKDLVKSPLNYIGGKFKLLPQILPLLPNETDTFVDLFGGGFNVGVNVKANTVIYNDIIPEVTNLLHYFYTNDLNCLLQSIDELVKKFNLSKDNKEGYLALRDYYNSSKHPIILYTLICHSFNNQIRFNSKGEFNMPFGVNRSSFNPSLRKRFIEFITKLQQISVEFYNLSFRDFNFNNLGERDFVYCDPPYLISTATYNENGGWTKQDESDLLNLLDDLHSKGIRFALSNVLKHKGRENELLVGWSSKYNVHYLKYDYSNCNYQSRKIGETVEVLVTNY